MKKTPFTADILTRFFQGSLDETQHQQILQWLSSLSTAEQDAFLTAHLEQIAAQDQKNDSIAEGVYGHNAQDPAGGFEQVLAKIEARKQQKTHVLTWTLRIAAALLPMVFAYFLLSQPQGDLVKQASVVAVISNLEKTNAGTENQQFYLPDSSSVTLYPGASVSYPSEFIQSKREVKLNGKAFFDIAKDATHPFIVHTEQVQTVVLGTSFWIDATKTSGKISVKVKTGKVGVKSHENQTVFLLPSEEAVFVKNTGMLAKTLPVVKTNHSERLAEHTPKEVTAAIAFNQTPIRQVFKALEEQYKVTITMNDSGGLQDQFITLSTRGKSLTTVLKEIKSQIQLNYEINGSHITIKSE